MSFWKKVFEIQEKQLERQRRIADSKFMRVMNKIAIIMTIIIAIFVITALTIFSKENNSEVKPNLYDINSIFTFVDRSGYYKNLDVDFNDFDNTVIIDIPLAYITGTGGYSLMNLKIRLYDTNEKILFTHINYDDTFLNPQEIVENYKITFTLKNGVNKNEISYISIEHEIEPRPQPINTAGTTTFIIMILAFGGVSILMLGINIRKIRKGIIITGEVVDSKTQSYYSTDGWGVRKMILVRYFINNESYLCEDSIPYFYSKTNNGKKYKVIHNKDNQKKPRLLINSVFVMIVGAIFFVGTLMMIYSLLKLLLII